MVKGFKKDGKFRPTGKNNKSTLKISDIREKKSIKMNKEGFRVRKGQQIYISKGSSGNGWSARWKEPPRKEVVDIFRDMWNNDPTVKKMKKHIDYVSMVNNKTGKFAGTWESGKLKVKIFDWEHMSPEQMKLTMAHEIVGHTFWDWSRKWRREELVHFNELANSMPPANPYGEENEEWWRKTNDDNDEIKEIVERQDELYKYYGESVGDEESKAYQEYNALEQRIKEIQNDPDHQGMTRYANEMHSAITELKYGVGEDERLYYLNDEQLEALSDAWDKLHY